MEILIRTDILNDHRLGRLPTSVKWHFIAICAFAGECDEGGFLIQDDHTLTTDEIAWRIREDGDELAASMQALYTVGLLEMDSVNNWVVSAPYIAVGQGPDEDNGS